MAPSCRKCRDHYGPGPKVPLTLQCGHTFCKSCLIALEKSDSLRCPICRRLHTWPPVSDLPVNDDLFGTPLGEEKGDGGTEEDRKQLLQAAAAGQVEKVLRLIWNGVAADTVSPREKDEGRRPLHLAADHGHENVVWALLQAKASPNILDNEGMAPIHLAAWGGHLASVTILLMHGADPQVKAKGRTALHWAAVGGHVTVLKELHHHSPATLHLPTADHHTPLHLAADNGNLKAVKWLVAEGVDPDLQDAQGRTALNLARDERHKDVVTFLSLTRPKLPFRPKPQPRTQPPAKPRHEPHQEEEDDDDDDDYDDMDDDADNDDADDGENIYQEVDEAPVKVVTRKEQVETFQRQQRNVAREIEERTRMGGERGRVEEAAAAAKRNAGEWKEAEERRQEEQEERMEASKKVSFNCPPEDDEDYEDDEDDDEKEEEEEDCDFTITNWLGQGDFGRDFLVQRNGVTQLLKKIELRNIPLKSREQIGQELGILQRIAHPHIVTSLGGEVRSNIVFLFSEHCPGGNLAERIREVKGRGKVFPHYQVLMWTVSLAQALSYLHNNSVMHRNLKPENLFLAEGSILKVGNFSFARFMNEDMATTYIGSPVYMSPEIIMGQRYDTKADMWSMGCILYELIKLERGYPYNHVKFPSHVDRKFRTVVKDLLNKEPNKRPSASELLNRPVFKATLQEKTVKEQKVGEMRRTSDYDC